MADIQVIRRLHVREGWSERRIARELHLSRRTVRKYLSVDASTEVPAYRRQAVVVAPKMGHYVGLIDQWLKEDEKAPVKQRHTARRIYVRLVSEYGASDVAESTVRHCVAMRRVALGSAKQVAFLVLEFPPGDSGQVDWGEALVKVDGVVVKAWMFCMRLCYSTASFVMLFPHGRMECFLEGHVRAFEFFGGVTSRIVYDNLSSAVKRILGRRRELNQRFATLAAHYVYEPVFANPAAGWEKGLVEGLVGYSRRNYLVPPPSAASFQDLNQMLHAQLLSEWDKPAHEREGRTVGQLLEVERAKLLRLPRSPYRASTTHTVAVSRQALVRHQTVRYSVPAALAGRNLRLEAFHDRVEVFDGTRRVAAHALARPGGPPVLDLDHYLDVLIQKPGGVRHARVVNQLGDAATAYRDAFLKAQPDGYAAFVSILMLTRHYTLEAVLKGIARAREDRVYEVEAVKALIEGQFSRAQASETAPAMTVIGPSVRQPSPAVYDSLLAVRP